MLTSYHHYYVIPNRERKKFFSSSLMYDIRVFAQLFQRCPCIVYVSVMCLLFALRLLLFDALDIYLYILLMMMLLIKLSSFCIQTITFSLLNGHVHHMYVCVCVRWRGRRSGGKILCHKKKQCYICTTNMYTHQYMYIYDK